MTATELRDAWSHRLRQLRQERKLTLDELAARAGATKSQLSKIENGVSGVSDDLKVRIARALDVEVTDAFPYPATTGEH